MKELLMKLARREAGAEEIPPNVIAEFHRAAEPDVRLPPPGYGLTAPVCEGVGFPKTPRREGSIAEQIQNSQIQKHRRRTCGLGFLVLA
jgi:hypothetical protein